MKIIVSLMLLIASTANANWAPKNKVKIPVTNQSNLVTTTGIDQATFNNVIDSILELYQPIVNQRGSTLVIKRLWANPTANSNTEELGSTWVVNAFGGLARFPTMSADGYAMVLCHEVGHHLGGFPKSNLGSWKTQLVNHWASNEGESDYFSSLKCFKRLIGNDPNNHFFTTCSKGVASRCCDKPDNEAAVCTRTVNAGMILAGVLHSLAGANEPFKLGLNTPDRTQVTRTFDGHPNSQCRLDTYVAGAICDADLNTPFSDVEPTQGACSEEAAQSFGFRSRCWYAPLK